MPRLRWLGVLGLVAVVLAACSASAAPSTPARSATTSASVLMTVYRSPDCSCCEAWSAILRQHGWELTTVDRIDMAAFKEESGVPQAAASCHTAILGDYFVEGHVPIAAIERLLSERPSIDGIALPGMPAGSPGMGGVAEGPLEVLAIDGGRVTSFGSY